MDWLPLVQVDVQLVTSVKNIITYIFQRHWETISFRTGFPFHSVIYRFNSPSYRGSLHALTLQPASAGVRNEAPNLATEDVTMLHTPGDYSRVYGAMVE